MAGIPPWALHHRMYVEPFEGSTGNGKRYGKQVRIRCYIEDGHRTKRSGGVAGGRDTGDEGTAWCELRWDRLVTPEARVRLFTKDGRLVEVVKVRRREYPGAPNHLEITFT